MRDAARSEWLRTASVVCFKRERVAAEEAIQLFHFAGGIVWLVEHLEPRQFGVD